MLFWTSTSTSTRGRQRLTDSPLKVTETDFKLYFTLLKLKIHGNFSHHFLHHFSNKINDEKTDGKKNDELAEIHDHFFRHFFRLHREAWTEPENENGPAIG